MAVKRALVFQLEKQRTWSSRALFVIFKIAGVAADLTFREKSTFLSGRKDHLRPVDIFKKMMPLRWNEPGLGLEGPGQIIVSQLIKPKAKRLEGPNLQKSSKETRERRILFSLVKSSGLKQAQGKFVGLGLI